MLNLNLASGYSLACALVPCVCVLIFRRPSANLGHRVWALIFCLYLWMVYDVTGAGGLSDIFLQLQLFQELGIHSLSDLIAALHNASGVTVFRSNVNLIPFQHLTNGFFLNILMFLPLGALLPFIWSSFRRPRVTILTGAAFSLLIECSQLFSNRTCDIDDLIANIAGSALGYGLWWLFWELFGARLRHSPADRLEPFLLILASFGGMFFLYHPFWFYRCIGY